ncbi:uncharacterized protein LOC123302844 [Chrysoperla carnea]|uniref:uncharacterized protein LOC123302844 n=1 Tax=Chrysoperla carnea TaxID=189513 RepID=UPI001D07E85F|nr:uncharacterized protein LOC123302844 [Chrysoperla carnea]
MNCSNQQSKVVKGYGKTTSKFLEHLKRNYGVDTEKECKVKYLCTAGDIWSGKKEVFVGVTVHWIDKNYKRHSAAMVYRRFKGAHTFDRIKDFLLEKYSDFVDPT